MKRKTLIHASVAVSAMAFMVAGTIAGISLFEKKAEKADAYTTQSSCPTTIDLNDTSTANIRSYYSSLNNLSTSERQGTNLLKNLKPILKNGQKYWNYDDGNTVWQMYEIIDRDWEKSPKTAISGYNASTNKITGYSYGTSTSNVGTNPYLHALYVNRNVTNQTTAWSDHTQTNWGINREHIWAKSHGFDDGGKGGARGDPMHLWAGNGYANNIHSNYFFGFVNTSGTYTNCGTKYSYVSGNLRGSSLNSSGTVFEPQDCDKGDIARAIFYMVARYNYYSGSDSDGIDTSNPNLQLLDAGSDPNGTTSYESSTTKAAYMGVMRDLLAWNRLDPPDEWEIHRNNLVYTNFSNNRNPFIDFPEWAEYIWGKPTLASNNRNITSFSTNPTGYAIPSSDSLNTFGNAVTTPTITLNKTSATLPVNGTVQLTATAMGGTGDVSWTTSNSSRAQLSATTGNTVTVTAKATGTATITATYSGKTATCAITVSATAPTVSSVTINPSTVTLDLNGTTTANLTATVSGTNNPAQTVTWSSNNTNCATISSSGLVTGLKVGTATITATSTVDDTKSGTCTVTVTKSSSGNGHWETSTTPYRKALFGASYNGTSINNYTSTWTATNSENATSTPFSVTVENANNNSNKWSYIRMGRKTYDSTGYITTADVVDQPIGKVGIVIDSVTAANITSLKLYYDDNAEFSNPSELSFTVETGNQTVEIESPESDLYYKIEAVCTAGSANGLIQISEVDYYNSTFISDGSATVSSVSVDPSYLNLDLNGTYTTTLSAEVIGEGDPAQTVTWSSNNTSIVTVSANGLVTGVGTGKAIITATSTVDVTKSGSCEVLVINSGASVTGATLTQGSPYINGIAYKMYFHSTSTNNNHYFSGAKNGNYGTTTTVINDATDVYFEANGTTGQNIYFMKDGEKNYFAVVATVSSGTTYYNFGFSTDTPTIPWYYQESGEDYACMTYTTNNTLYTFGTYSTYTTIGTVNLGTYTNNYEIDFVSHDTLAPNAFSQLFLSSLICNAQGTSAPTLAAGISWEQLAKVFYKIDSSLQAIIENASANENGSIIEQAAARYDYVLNKYGVDTYFNFLSREIGSSSKVLGKMVVTNNAVLLLVVMATLGTFTFAAWFIHKKKQYDL